MFRKLAIVLCAAFAVSAGSASAYTIFFGEDAGLGEAVPLPPALHINSTAASNAFLASLVGVGTETFEGFAPGAPSPINLVFPGAGAATLTSAGGAVASVAPGTTNGFGRYAISGSQFFETGSDLLITFGAPVAAFGFWGVDIGDFNGQITLTVQGGGVTVLNVGNTQNGPGGSVLFYGLIAQNPGELFTSIQFGNTAAGVDFFAFDDMTIGSIEQVRRVPEPGSLVLVGLALTLVGIARRRRA